MKWTPRELAHRYHKALPAEGKCNTTSGDPRRERAMSVAMSDAEIPDRGPIARAKAEPTDGAVNVGTVRHVDRGRNNVWRDMIKAGIAALDFTYLGPPEDREAFIVSSVFQEMLNEALKESD